MPEVFQTRGCMMIDDSIPSSGTTAAHPPAESLIVRGTASAHQVFNVALQLDAKRTVIPQTVETAVNF